MELCTLSDVLQMLETFYNMKVVSVECLEAFEDSNLRLKTSSTDGMLYDVVLKLSSLVSPKVACSVDLQTSMMKYLKDSGVRVSNVIETCSNELYFVQKTNRGPDLCGRLLTYMSGEQLDKVPDISPLLKEVGTLVGEMDRILQTFSPTQTENINTEWGLSKASLMREMLAKFCSQDFQLLGTEILDAFEERLLPMIYRFQSGYIHGDVIGSNILVSQEANAQFYAVSGVIDFGDAVEGTYVYEIATLMADVMALNPDKAFDVGRELLDGFCSKFKLHEEELSCDKNMQGRLRCCFLLLLLFRAYKLNDEFGNEFNDVFNEVEFDFDIEDGPWSVLPYGHSLRNMDDLCQHSDICSTKLGYKVDRSGPSCCTGCSCESDCGLTQNCCFPELDIYQIPGPDKDFSSCVYPVTKVYAENLPIHSYIMIDRCPSEKACNPCGEQIVAEWGSLHPVYSNETGLIYKNQKCAECYNVTDGQIWEPYQIVNLKEGLKSLPIGGHLLTSKLGDRNNMIVRFMPPEGVHLDRHACFENIISSCEHDGAYRLFGNLTDHQICQTGLYAPHFHDGHYFSNIFCAICIMDSRTMWKEMRKCTPQSVEPAGDFLVSINKTLTFNNVVSERKQVCTFNGKKCKDVLCPIGHIWLDGNCVLIHSKWFHKNIQIVLEFNPKTENDRVTAYRLEDIDVSISVPSETKWLLRKVITEQTDSGSILRVYAEMFWNQTKSDRVTSAEIVEASSELVKQSRCNIQYITSSFTYEGSISRYAYFDETDHQPLWKAIKQNTNLQGGQGSPETLTEMTIVYTNNGIPKDDGVKVSINKLFFCEQVELKHREFVTYFNGTQLYQKETGNTYLDGEFLLMEQKQGNQVGRICLKNSGYYVIKSGSCKMTFGISILLMSVYVGLLLI